MKKKTKRLWTKAEMKALKKHSKNRTPIAAVSKEMKRTIGALRVKAYTLGFGLGQYR